MEKYGTPTNDRGFLGYDELTDSHGQRIRLIESSADPLVHCHLYVGQGGVLRNGEWEDGRRFERAYLQGVPHLNVRQAVKLIRILTKFVEHKLAMSSDEHLSSESL